MLGFIKTDLVKIVINIFSWCVYGVIAVDVSLQIGLHENFCINKE